VQQIGQIEKLGALRLASGKSQKLGHKRGRTLAIAADLFSGLLVFIWRLVTLQNLIGQREDGGEDTGPIAAAAALQAAISGRSRRRRVELGSGNVSLPEHVRQQIKEASAGPGASQPVPSQAALKAFKSPNTAKALRSQGFLAQLREKRTKASLLRSAPKKLYPIYFKFQEGFTNAVKRPVTLEELVGPMQ
jgi:hypothetical protein